MLFILFTRGLRVDGVRVGPYRRLDVAGAAPPPRERTETQFRPRGLAVVASELTLGATAYSGRVVMQGGVGQVARRPSSKQAGPRQDAALVPGSGARARRAEARALPPPATVLKGRDEAGDVGNKR